MKFNITEESYNIIIRTIKDFPMVDEAIIFGSRAKGNSKKGSDIDIAIKGEQISQDDVISMSAMLNEELPLPYFFDIIDYKTIKNDSFKQHIDRVGKTIFSREFDN